MFSTARKTVATFAALGALALGGSAIAGAAQNSTATTSSTNSSTQQGQPPNGGRHVGANGKTEQALDAATAAKVKAAALKKLPGGTVERVETDVDHGSPYEAHVTKADGTQVEVLVNKDFQVTAVNTMQHP
jgi:uncharacterized membrane protein YkoI